MNYTVLEYINTFRKSGTVIASSKRLINKCLKNIEFANAKVIVEFGMGNGCITEEILKKCNKDTIVISFELNPKFCDYCSTRFETNNQLKIVNQSAFNFHLHLAELRIEKVDYIISSLPISLFSKNETLKLLEDSKRYLKDEGNFIQYQYSLSAKKSIRETFSDVKMDFTMFNFPPAFIYNCR